MIVVIADDLTGAAEIGAVGLRYGLTAEVQTEFAPESNADLIVIDTDTRSMPGSEAAAEVERVVGQVLQHSPELLFKKVDSVLRGPVLAELTALLRATGVPRLLLVPANPSLGRVIRDRNYYVDDVHWTSSLFERTSSSWWFLSYTFVGTVFLHSVCCVIPLYTGAEEHE